jgi:hypothetical protein
MIRSSRAILFCATAVLLVTPVLAQDKPQPEMTPEQKAEMEIYQKAATPGVPHKTMAKSAGSYDLKIKSWHEPGAEAVEETGTAKRTMILDGRVRVEEVESTMMGEPFMGHGMMGYDNVTNEYWGTWNDNMGTGVMVTEGTCDAKELCKFTGTYNDPVKKKAVKMRMTSRWTSPTTEIFEMYGPDKSGKEMKFMEITYTKR